MTFTELAGMTGLLFVTLVLFAAILATLEYLIERRK